MNFVVIKPGAGFPTLRPAGVRIIQALQDVADTHGVDLIITSGSEGRGRAADDPHMTGEAADVSVGNLRVNQIRNIYDDLRTKLGTAFTVLYECPPGYTPDPHLVAANMVYISQGATAPHFHIQRRKGTVYPPPIDGSGERVMRAIVAFIMAGIFASSASAQGLNLSPSLTMFSAALADTGTTYFGIEHGTCSGEKTPRYWTDGDWQRPDYRKMVVYNIASAGVAASLQWFTHRQRVRHPDSRTIRWVDRSVAATWYGLAGWRGFAAARNVARCW